MKNKQFLLTITLIIILLLGGFLGYLRSRYEVPILMYHRVDDDGQTSSLSVSPENFEKQMRFLSRHNYNVISLKEYVRAKRENRKPAFNTVVITFDDGYADNYDAAYPILQQYNLPATIFVIVDSIGKEEYLDYSQIKEMLSSGIIDIQSHTLLGDYLPGHTPVKLEKEIGLSKKILEKKLDKTVDLICYPIGGFSPEIQEMVKDAGYQAACTTNRGKTQSCFNDDIYALKRIKIKDGSCNLFVFWVKVSGYYNVFRKVKKPF